MERRTFKVTYFLRKARTGKNGLAPILARITTNRLVQDVYIQCSADPERWDQGKGRATGRDKYSVEVNNSLDDFRARVVAVRNELIRDGQEGNAIEIKERLTHPAKTRMFLDEFSAYCDKRQKEVGITITQASADKFHRTLRYLREYTQGEYRKPDIPLSSLSHDYLHGFYIFLQTRHTCRNNGAVNLLKTIRSFIIYCLRNDWLKKNPMQDMRLKMERNAVRAHLTRAELEIIVNKEMPNERLEQVRDVFVFCCLTGMAFIDAYGLGPEHLGRDEKGKLWIRKPRQKTGIDSTIPLLPIARQILDKYADNPTCKMKGKLLPVCSNQRMNAYLKEIGTICNIGKTLTTHCARHTFASVAGNYGMPLKVIARILGHAKVKMTEHYTHLWESTVSEEMEKLGERIGL